MKINRIFDILELQLAKNPLSDALANKVNGKWTSFSTQEYINIVNKTSLGLLDLGIKKDDTICIISPNRPEWNFVEMAIQQIGAISVPIYPTVTTEDFKFIFNDAAVKIVFVANQDLYEKAIQAAKFAPSIQHIYSFEKTKECSFWKELHESKRSISELESIKSTILASDTLTIMYTSGTTGVPKGVMLSHANLVSQCEAASTIIPISAGGRAFSFLPLCHVYERMLSYVYQSTGISIYYAENLETIADNLKEVHPNVFVTVPRLLEKVYDKIIAKGHDLTGIKRKLFFWAVELGMRYEINTKQGFWYDLQLKIANKIIFNKWREALGGKIKVIVSGGAALQPRLARIFSAAQVVIMEGYGLTETSPVIAVNRYEEKNRKIGTVGPIFPGVEVKIAADGEILTRGPHIMKGYYKRPDLTADAIDADGWFKTGDIGTIVDDKFLKITDRKKEMFKTSGGKYIAPGNMENKFKESKFIEQIMVIGDARNFPAALVVPSFATLKDWCLIKNITFTNPLEMIENNLIIKKMEEEIEKLNPNFAQFERIKKIALLSNEWTIAKGELTPTLKLKRKIIMQNYADKIELIYADKSI